jgi:NAD(P)-dependent dehydrogenase (short-subunit alcohol dehydrogenase family)
MPQKIRPKKRHRAAQTQSRQPGIEAQMRPRPRFAPRDRRRGRLAGKVALISGGDSGIGRAVAVAFAQEGADVAIAYLDEHGDARHTAAAIRRMHRRCLLLAGDIGDESFCQRAVRTTLHTFRRLDILVNNAAEQHTATRIEDITAVQIERTFRTNVFASFFLTKAAVPHMKPGGSIINTASVTAYRGSSHLIDYASTKGAIVAFTRSLSQSLTDRKIRVNAVAPGPIWTPLIPASMSPEEVATFGSDVPMGRVGQPAEVAPCFVFLASEDASYMSGQVLHPNGGEIVNG